MLSRIKKQKKSVSIMIGYVLLISFAIVMGGIVYQWMKTYVPAEMLKCPDGVSVFIKDINCESSGGNFILNITLKNNGRFDIGGYFIYATENESQELATKDLSANLIVGGNRLGNAIVFAPESVNILNPSEKRRDIFNLTNAIYSVEITPARFQEEKNKKRFVNCGEAKVKEEIVCG